MKKLLQLAREEDGTETTPEGELIEATDLITAEEDLEELNATETEVAEITEGIADAETTETEVAEVIEEQEEKLESTDPITPVEVVVATEGLKFLAKSIGLNLESISDHVVSHEDAAKDPRVAYGIAHEGFKEVAATIATSIKDLYKKLIARIKVLVTQVAVYLASREKSTTALLGQVQKGTWSADAKWEEPDTVKWSKRIASVVAYGNGKVSESGSEFITYLTAIADSKLCNKYAGIIIKAGVAAKGAGADDQGAGVKAGILASVNDFEKKVGEYIKSTPASFVKAPSGEAMPFRFDGSSVKVFFAKDEEGGVSFGTETLSFTPEFFKAAEIAFPTKAAAELVLKAAIVNIKSTKTFSTAALKHAEEISKVIEGAATVIKPETAAEKEAVAKLNRVVKMAKTYATGVAVDGIMGLIKSNKDVIAYFNAAATKASKAPAA